MAKGESANGAMRFFDPGPLPLPVSSRSSLEWQILDAARRCLIQYSSTKASINDVARVAGVSRGSVYNYFPDRQALFTAVSELAVEMFAQQIERAMGPHDSFEEQISAAAVVVLQWADAERTSGLYSVEEEAIGLTVGSAPLMRALMDVTKRSALEAQGREELRTDLDLDQAAEWVARILLSLLAVPSHTFDVSRPSEVKAFIRAHLVRGLH